MADDKYKGICIGGPAAGRFHSGSHPRVRFVNARALVVFEDFEAQALQAQALRTIQDDTTEYRFERIPGADVWVIAEWKMEEVVREILRNYRPTLLQATVFP